jgi:UDP-N-acetylglucosamine 2-epimerase (non-hydrolysing)
VDDPGSLANVLAIVRDVAERLPVIWPIHPRTMAKIEEFDFKARLESPRMVCLPSQGYLEMIGLMRDALVVLTDSGGIQEETTALGVPCLTMRPNTERPITVEQGTNIVVGSDRHRVLAAVDEILNGGGKHGRVPELWDGKAAARIADHMAAWLTARSRSNSLQ